MNDENTSRDEDGAACKANSSVSAYSVAGPGSEAPSTLLEQARAACWELLASLPNELSRLIYLTSLRDYNSGAYRQYALSNLYGSDITNTVLQQCHQKVFQNLLEYTIDQYVQELRVYIRYTGCKRNEVISAWTALQAYRAAIPYPTPPSAASEAFFVNISSALSLLERESLEISEICSISNARNSDAN
jgi:hypothetical protein